jgi:hypothetical protein
VVENKLRLQIVLATSLGGLIAASSIPNLSHESFEFTKFFQQRFVREIGQVLDVVVNLIGTLWRLVGDPGIDSFQDTEATGGTKERRRSQNSLKEN